MTGTCCLEAAVCLHTAPVRDGSKGVPMRKAGKLNICVQREYNSYLWGALPLCAVLAEEHTLPWYLEHFVQLYSESSPSDRDALHADFYDSFAYQEILETVTLDWAAARSYGDVIDIIRVHVDAGFYCVIFVDDGHIRNEGASFLREYLVFGYDDTLQRLDAVGFDNGAVRMFSSLQFTYEKFSTAFRNALDSPAMSGESSPIHFPIQLLHHRATVPPFDRNRFAHRLRDYLAAPSGRPPVTGNEDWWRPLKASGDWWRGPHAEQTRNDLEVHSGLRVYDHLIGHLKSVANGTADLDYRLFHLLVEHKRMILQRMKFIAKENCLQVQFSDPLGKFLTLADELNRFRLRLLFKKPEKIPNEAMLGIERLPVVQETESRLLEQMVRVVEG